MSGDAMMGSLMPQTADVLAVEPRKLLVKYDPVHYGVNGQLKFRLKFAQPGDVGLDLPVVIDERLKVQPPTEYYINLKEQWFDVPPVGYAEVPCGLSVKVPEDSWGHIMARSSTGWRRRLVVTESVIDSGFTGPLHILVFNPNNHPVRVKAGEKLAQLILIPKYRLAGIEPVGELPKTERGLNCFGSSGF